MPSLPMVNAFLSDLIVCALLYTHELCHSHTAEREREFIAIYFGEEETTIDAIYYAKVISKIQMLASTWW